MLEGELVRDRSNNWSFLIGDLLCYKGEKEVSNISIRFNKIYTMLGNCIFVYKIISLTKHKFFSCLFNFA